MAEKAKVEGTREKAEAKKEVAQLRSVQTCPIWLKQQAEKREKIDKSKVRGEKLGAKLSLHHIANNKHNRKWDNTRLKWAAVGKPQPAA